MACGHKIRLRGLEAGCERVAPVGSFVRCEFLAPLPFRGGLGEGWGRGPGSAYKKPPLLWERGLGVRSAYAVWNFMTTRPRRSSSPLLIGVGVLGASFCLFTKVKLVLFSSSTIYWLPCKKILACSRETPPSSPPWGVRSTSG